MDVEITSQREMANGETRVGNGTLRQDKNRFIFEEELPTPCRKNPKVYSGRYFTVRTTKDGRLRFTAIMSKTEIAELISRKGKAIVKNDLMSAIEKLNKKYL